MDTMTSKWVGTMGSRRVYDHHRAHPDDAIMRDVVQRAARMPSRWDRVLAVDFGQKERQG
jgi:hypothetical protein